MTQIIENDAKSVHDGSPPFQSRMTSRVDTLLQASREGLRRVSPHDLAGEVAAGAVVVDIRPAENGLGAT